MITNKLWHEPKEIPAFNVGVALIVRMRLRQNFGYDKEIMVRHFLDKTHYDQICRWEDVLAWAYTIDLIPDTIWKKIQEN